MKRIAAFFDIDGTLYRNSLMIDHLKKLIKYEIVGQEIWLNSLKNSYNEWSDRKQDYDYFLEKCAYHYINSITGLKEEYLEFCAEMLIKLKGNRVYTYTRDVIKEHLEKGHLVIFISGSPDYLVRKMGEKYNVHISKGSEYIIEDGIFTGKVKPLWDSKSKDDMINELVEKYSIDLEKSYAYGDTNGDYYMLKKVGNPVAINPSNELTLKIKKDKELSNIAKIVVERKDNIYILNSNVEIFDRRSKRD